MKKLFWDNKGDHFVLRNNPDWCEIIIDKNIKMTINYEDDFRKRVITKSFKKTTTAMNVARIVYDKLSCHRRGRKEVFDVDLPGSVWNIK